MCWLLRSALEHVKEMQSSGKGYLPRNDLKEVPSDYAVKAMDWDSSGPEVCAPAPHTQKMKQKFTSASCAHCSVSFPDGAESKLEELDSTLMMTRLEGLGPP